jgi:hypothetical protein
MVHGLIAESVASCGLICRLCFLADRCDGCKSAINRCEGNCSDEGCFQKACCQANGYAGCWLCTDLERCTEGIYRDGSRSKVRAFALCIRQDGLEAFIGHVLRSQQAGLRVEKGGDYDGLPADVVLRLLRSGRP